MSFIHARTAGYFPKISNPGKRANSARTDGRYGRSKVTRLAFSLIEMIAIMALLAIVASATVPMLVKQADDVAESTEVANLKVIAEAFRGAVAQTRSIPDPAQWATFVASKVGLPVSSVRTNARGNARVFLVDPALRIGAVSPANLPYQQGTSAYPVTNPRFLIVSSLSTPLPALSQSDFNTLWGNPEGTIPAGWTSWQQAGGTGHDLKVARIDLTPSFDSIVLQNTSSNSAAFQVDASVASLPPGAITNFFFAGTVVNLLTNPLSRVQVSQLLTRNAGWTFTNWTTTNTIPRRRGRPRTQVLTNEVWTYFRPS